MIRILILIIIPFSILPFPKENVCLRYMNNNNLLLEANIENEILNFCKNKLIGRRMYCNSNLKKVNNEEILLGCLLVRNVLVRAIFHDAKNYKSYQDNSEIENRDLFGNKCIIYIYFDIKRKEDFPILGDEYCLYLNQAILE